MLNPESKLHNIRRSFHKFLQIKLIEEPGTPRCWINFGETQGTVPEGNKAWLDIHWLPLTGGVFTDQLIQINVLSKAKQDQYGNLATELADEVMGHLNETIAAQSSEKGTITLYNFADPANLVDLFPFVLIPRFKEAADLPYLVGGLVRGIHLDYTIYLCRSDVL